MDEELVLKAVITEGGSAENSNKKKLKRIKNMIVSCDNECLR